MYIVIAADRSTKRPINQVWVKDSERAAKRLQKELKELGWEQPIILPVDSIHLANGIEITGILQKAQEFSNALHSDPPINLHKRRQASN